MSSKTRKAHSAPGILSRFVELDAVNYWARRIPLIAIVAVAPVTAKLLLIGCGDAGDVDGEIEGDVEDRCPCDAGDVCTIVDDAWLCRPPGPLPSFVPCSTGVECSSGVCLSAIFFEDCAAGCCAQLCSGPDDCAGELACIEIGPDVRVCSAS
jgi:hypothetical protein